jgi:hypothetical protein
METLKEFDTHGSVHRRLLSRNTNKKQLCNRIYYSKHYLKAQHVSSGRPLIIRNSKLYLQPLVYYAHTVTGRCQDWVGTGISTEYFNGSNVFLTLDFL